MDEAQFINYEQFHKSPNKVDNPQTEQSTKKLGNSPSRKMDAPRVDTVNRGKYSGRNYSKEEVQELIKNYSAEFGIDREAPLCIAKLESGYNQFSKNKSSSVSGVFQYLSGTWRATDEGRIGLSVFDADANVKAAVKYMASRKSAKPWTVHTKCPSIKSIN